MARCPGALLFVLLAGPAASQDDAAARLSGRVVDEQGAPVAHAWVVCADHAVELVLEH